jgi:hypothetical protein
VRVHNCVTVGACPQLARLARRPGPKAAWGPCQARFRIIGLIMCVMSNWRWRGCGRAAGIALPDLRGLLPFGVGRVNVLPIVFDFDSLLGV